MSVRGAGLSDRGVRRSGNEDAILVDDARALYIVADGVGGRSAGEVASALACEAVAAFMRTAVGLADLDALDTALRVANEHIVAVGARDAAQAGMSTTIVALAVSEDEVTVAHAGDSRCYRLRRGRLTRLTRDHSLSEQYFDHAPELRDRVARYKNVVTRALGAAPAVTPDVRSEPHVRGDLYMLCSDGLSNVLDHDEIEGMLVVSGDDLEAACRSLVAEVNRRGGPDNVSVVVVRVEHAGDEQQ